MYHHLRIRHHALHVDKVLRRVDGGPHEQVLDVVVRAPEPEEGVGRLEAVVPGLGELADWRVDKLKDGLGRGRDWVGGWVRGVRGWVR